MFSIRMTISPPEQEPILKNAHILCHFICHKFAYGMPCTVRSLELLETSKLTFGH